jgi:DNA polymerase III sliding clamp (beta) subunit (PCNA family)
MTAITQATSVAPPALAPRTRIICSRVGLLDVLSTAATVAPAKSPKKALEDVLIRTVSAPGPDGDAYARAQRVEILATDLETSVRLVVAQADVERVPEPAGRGSPGSGASDPLAALDPLAAPDPIAITLNCRKLLGLVKAIASDHVELRPLDDGKVRISGGKTVYNMLATPNGAREFPDLSFLSSMGTGAADQPQAWIDGEALEVALSRTAFAAQASGEAGRVAADGVCFDWNSSRMQLAATEFHHFAAARVIGAPGRPAGLTPATIFSVVRNGAVAALRRFIEGVDRVGVAFAPTGSRVVFVRGGAVGNENALAAQLSQNPFPPYERALPPAGSLPLSVEIERAPLLDAIQRAALVTSTESKAITLAFVEGVGVRVSGRGADVGDGADEVACAWKGAPFAIGFDPALIAKAFGAIDHDMIRLEFTDPGRPMVVRTEDGWSYVVSPIQHDEAGAGAGSGDGGSDETGNGEE